MSRARVLLADDHADVADHAAALMADAFDVVGMAADGVAAVTECASLKPDVVVLDVAMPGMNGLDAARRILAAQPEVCVVMLSVHDEPEYVDAALSVGASAYVFKQRMGGDLVGAVQDALGGRVFVSSRRPPGARSVAEAPWSPALPPVTGRARSRLLRHSARSPSAPDPYGLCIDCPVEDPASTQPVWR